MIDFFFIRIGKRHLKVKLKEILCIEGYENYIKLYTENKMHLVMITMKEIEKYLPPDFFCRVHRSWIVGVCHIVEFDELSVELKDKSIPIGNVYKDGLLKKVVIVNRSKELRKNPETGRQNFSLCRDEALLQP